MFDNQANQTALTDEEIRSAHEALKVLRGLGVQTEQIKQAIAAQSVPTSTGIVPANKPAGFSISINSQTLGAVAGVLGVIVGGYMLLMSGSRQEASAPRCGLLSQEQVNVLLAHQDSTGTPKADLLNKLGQVPEPCVFADVAMRQAGDGSPVILRRIEFGVPAGTLGNSETIMVAFEGETLRGISATGQDPQALQENVFAQIVYRGMPLGAKIGDLSVTTPLAFIGLSGVGDVKALSNANVIGQPETNSISVELTALPGYYFIVSNVNNAQTRFVEEGQTLFSPKGGNIAISVMVRDGQELRPVAPTKEILAIFLNQPLEESGAK